ncbi:MAG TPA: DUF4258 domain-containing protein [Casimicrobiaceae bacterium]|nr:DUF4258 domain-containing protein [Casimicrobiaceae bacterium]
MHPTYTDHARARMQQRGIDQTAIDCLLEFGTQRHDGRGAVVVYLDKRAQRRLLRERRLAPAEMERIRRFYVVLADGAIVTTGHRYARVHR